MLPISEQAMTWKFPKGNIERTHGEGEGWGWGVFTRVGAPFLFSESIHEDHHEYRKGDQLTDDRLEHGIQDTQMNCGS